jgi:hypothetical protein
MGFNSAFKVFRTKRANQRVSITKRATLYACTALQLRFVFFWDMAVCHCITGAQRFGHHTCLTFKGRMSKGGYTLVTLPRIVTPYRDSVDETRARVTYQKLVTR